MAQLPTTGLIDADGHVLEPADLWSGYLEEGFRARGIRLRVNDDGLEYLELDGAPMSLLSPGALGMLGAMGDAAAAMGPDRRYMEVMPQGACNPKDRLAWLDAHGLDAVILYPRSASSGRHGSPTASWQARSRAPTTGGSPTSAARAMVA